MSRIDYSKFQMLDAKLENLSFKKIAEFNNLGGYLSGTVVGLTPYINNKITLARIDDYSAPAGSGFCVTPDTIDTISTLYAGAMGGLVPLRRDKLASLITPYVAHSPVYYYEYKKLSEYLGTSQPIAAISKGYASYLYPLPDGSGTGSVGVSAQAAIAEVGQQLAPANQLDISNIGDWIVITNFRLYDNEELPRVGQDNKIVPTVLYSGSSAFYFQYAGGSSRARKIIGDLQLVFPFYPLTAGTIRGLIPSIYLSANNSLNTIIRICDSIKGIQIVENNNYIVTYEGEQASTDGVMLVVVFSNLKTVANTDYSTGFLRRGINVNTLINGDAGSGVRGSYLIFRDTESFERICKDFGIVASPDLSTVQNTPIDYFPDNGAVVPDGGSSTGFPTNPIPNISSFPDNTSDIINENSPNVSALSSAGVYALTVTQTKDFLRWLMTDDFTQNISNLFNDKLSAVGDLKIMPFDIALHDPLHATASEQLTVGNVTGNVTNHRITDNYNTWINGGEYTYTAYYGDFNDFERCSYSLYIPYAGIIDLDAGDVVNKTLRLSYAVDLLTGNATAVVYSNNVIVRTTSATMGISVPITSTNNNQRQLNNALTALSVGRGLVNGAISSALSMSPMPLVNAALNGVNSAVNNALTNPLVTQHSGGFGNGTGLSLPQTAFLIITRQVIASPTGYKELVGVPATYRGKISEFVGSGFVSVSADKIDIPCTQSEREEILSALTRGIYL